MESSNPPKSSRADVHVPVAHIEAQDKQYAEPIREYFLQHGCTVTVNSYRFTHAQYVIIVGDSHFVKHILDHHAITNARILAVIYSGLPDDLKGNMLPHVRYCFVDDKPLTKELVLDICTYFFAGNTNMINIRKEPPSIKITHGTGVQASREQEPIRVQNGSSHDTTGDATRIQNVMAQVFHSTSTHAKKRKRTFSTGLYVAFGVFIFLAPYIFYFIALCISVLSLGISFWGVQNNSYVTTQKSAAYGTTYVRSARSILSVFAPVFNAVHFDNEVRDQEALLSVMQDALAIANESIHISQFAKRVFTGFIVSDKNDTEFGISDVVSLTSDMTRVSERLGLMSAQIHVLLTSGRFPFSSSYIRTYLGKADRYIDKARDVVDTSQKLLALYPRISGYRKEQTYLVLLQNSMEIRPTGGFIGSLLLVTIADGKVQSIEVQDVYSVDGQLKGHIDPPMPIREILGQEHWYLRDSNWHPDFVQSAQRAAWFYEKETEIHPDGVIAVSLPFVLDLLKATGPIELIDFNERISESNFYAKSLVYTQTDFFPGSTQKKDFLGALIHAMLTKLTTDSSVSSEILFSAVSHAIKSKDIQFYFEDAELQELVRHWQWDGGLDLSSCTPIDATVHCTGDGVGLVQANLGVNKINYFTSTEALSHISIFADGTVEHALTVNIKNNAPTQTDGGGVYESFLRVLVPLDAVFIDATLDGVDIPVRDDAATIHPVSYFRTQIDESVREYQIPVPVAPGVERQLMVRWSREQLLPILGSREYQVNVRKQPGVQAFPWHVVVDYPNSWQAAADAQFANSGKVEYNTSLDTDKSVRVSFR